MSCTPLAVVDYAVALNHDIAPLLFAYVAHRLVVESADLKKEPCFLVASHRWNMNYIIVKYASSPFLIAPSTIDVSNSSNFVELVTLPFSVLFPGKIHPAESFAVFPL